MKSFLTFIASFLCGTGFAANPINLGSGTFAWERSPDDLLTNGMVYKLYASVANGPVVTTTNAYTGTNLSATVTNLAPGTWYFTATAVQGGVESIPSNVLPYFVPALPPRPPGKLFMIYTQSTLNFTNWTDMGAFRAVLQVWP